MSLDNKKTSSKEEALALRAITHDHASARTKIYLLSTKVPINTALSKHSTRFNQLIKTNRKQHYNSLFLAMQNFAISNLTKEHPSNSLFRYILKNK